MPRLTFHGAAETVTGSKYLLEAGRSSVLFDCGMFQGLKQLRLLNWNHWPFPPDALDSVVLTHAHVDHVGMLPRLVRQGFRGPIYCTPATSELAELILFDTAKLQEDDAEYANRKGYSKHKPALPLFTGNDVQKTLKLMQPVERNGWFKVAEEIWCRYHDIGHLLGSCSIEVEIRNGTRPLRLMFSGDVGRYNAPLYHDPAPPAPCDYLVCESTYGDRDHPPDDLLDSLTQVVVDAIRRGGVMLVAAFAVGRAQQLVYLLNVLAERNRIPVLPIFIDSPMAVDATEIYTRYRREHDLSELELEPTHCALRGRNIHFARTAAESKEINSVPGPAVIISSSGMMSGGRILHHLRQRLPEPRNTIVLGGFQAEGTRGRALKEGAKYLRMHGMDVPVRAQVAEISGLSGHAGRSELLRWLSAIPAPRRTFLTHGEKQASLNLAEELRRSRGWNVTVPRMGESVELEASP
ncbi:MAG: MBL fold metallo-hydrolase [Pirellulales bacterium]|nr:MBL fold metallo-hydrolase [Pirellulales bacterium]